MSDMQSVVTEAGDTLWSSQDNIYFKAAHAAKLFCIAAALIIPNLLVIYVLL